MAVTMTLAVTLLNPHVYLDTVVLLGAISADFSNKQAFAAGADIASAVTDITLNPDPEARIREWLQVTA